MKRLSSYVVYLFAAILPFAIIVVTQIFKDYMSSPKRNLVVGVFALIVIFIIYSLTVYLFLVKSKRLFYHDSSVYAYSLFSKKMIVINRSEVRFIGRVIYFSPIIWKFAYYDENGVLKTIYFIRNMLDDNFSQIADELNQ